MDRELLISALEMYFEHAWLIKAGIEFTNRQREIEETVTLSEHLAMYCGVLPSPIEFRKLWSFCNELTSLAPDHKGNEGWSNWSCCHTHERLAYMTMLLRAIADAYDLDSEGQPLSEQWLIDFEHKKVEN